MRNSLKDTRLFVFRAGILSLTVIALALLFIFSCNNLLVLGSGGTLIVSVPGGRSASDDATIYTIELNGSAGTVYRKTVSAGQTAAFEELEPDTYSILVKGSNDEGIVVYYGSATAIVEAGKTATAMVELMELLGGLTVEFSGTAATSNGKNFSVDLRGSSGFLYTKTVAAGETAQFERLVPDIYTIDVHGTNAKNAVLYHGINTATVEVGKKTSATVDLVVEATDFESLKEAIAAGGTVYVLNDITVTESLTISNDVEIRALDKDVTLTYTGDGSLFIVNKDTANLTIGDGDYKLKLAVEATDFESLKEGIESGGIVYVLNDITVTESLTISKDVEIRALDKNVTLRHTGDGSLFIVNKDTANLTIGGGDYRLTVDGNGKTRSQPLLNIIGGTVHLYGTITNGISSGPAGGVEIASSSTLYMYDGATVSNWECTASWGRGGAIAVRSGAVMNMYGGTITGSTADFGAAVYINDGMFTMSGGTISGNIGKRNDSAVEVSGIFEMGGSAMFGSNDRVYLANKDISRFIKVISPLTGTGPVATIISDRYSSGTPVLVAENSVTLANEVGKFALSSGTIKSDGTLQ